jgi:hypothetical protein
MPRSPLAKAEDSKYNPFQVKITFCQKNIDHPNNQQPSKQPVYDAEKKQ